MKKIEAYKTSDGMVFTDKEKAEAHEKEFLFNRRVNTFAENYGYYEGVIQIREAILEHPKELQYILNDRFGKDGLTDRQIADLREKISRVIIHAKKIGEGLHTTKAGLVRHEIILEMAEKIDEILKQK